MSIVRLTKPVYEKDWKIYIHPDDVDHVRYLIEFIPSSLLSCTPPPEGLLGMWRGREIYVQDDIMRILLAIKRVNRNENKD